MLAWLAPLAASIGLVLFSRWLNELARAEESRRHHDALTLEAAPAQLRPAVPGSIRSARAG